MGDVATGMEGLLRVESGSAEAPFEQVRRQLAEAVADRRLGAGTKLPPIRALAGELGLAANTVARAYRELEEAGLVITRGRLGTVVSPGGVRGGASAGASGGDAVVRLAAADYARAARAAGIAEADAVALVRDAYRRRD
jgi:DNA-binding transcriptional regulator YhcF (GntR family)